MSSERILRTSSAQGSIRLPNADENPLGADPGGTLSSDPSPSGGERPPRRVLGRISFSHKEPAVEPRASLLSRWRQSSDGASGKASNVAERAPIPSALQTSKEPYTAPLPVLSMIVLSITMLGEFLSANVSTPFLLFMVEGFGQITDKAEIAFWTGILVSAFFLTQFLTSLLWATVADRHGARTVLFISLLGSAITCAMFGTSTSLKQAISIRLLQGIFAGAVGVARGCVTIVTDPSNEGRAYAILGFCWGFGGVAGAIIGGTFESPAQKWPEQIGHFPIFVKYPYLLPTALAALITFIGSILALFLGPDGGPREGAIRLPVEKDAQRTDTIPEEPDSADPFLEESPKHGVVETLRQQVSQRLSGYFGPRSPDVQGSPSSPVPLATQTGQAGQRSFSRTSRANGSAYGYGTSYRRRLTSASSLGVRRGSLAAYRRRSSAVDPGRASVSESSDLNFAQRLLMANENAVTNIADLWVAAAMNVDNEDPFETDSESEVEAESRPEDDEDASSSVTSTPTQRGRVSAAQSPKRSSNIPPRLSLSSRHRPSVSQPRSSRIRGPSFVSRGDEEAPPRRSSSGGVPAIFAHPGVRTPAAVLDAQQLLSSSEDAGGGGDVLTPIGEHLHAGPEDGAAVPISEKPPSLFSQLPVLIIIQYGLLALHSTTHDQVFLSYLVSEYDAGGLNLNAGHFAQLIALMCLAQIAYQFYLYPNVGPPRGRFSHLAMFQLGSFLFIPAYLTVIPYRAFASEGNAGNMILMTGLAVSTAIRYCGITFAYTAIAILLNYMTPPNAVGFANGVAQSIVSLARCFGPVLGGYLWSASVEHDPSGYSLGFVVCGAVCGVALLTSFFIR